MKRAPVSNKEQSPVIRVLIVGGIAAGLYPAFSSAVALGEGLFNVAVFEMTVFPVLVGVAGALACRNREPLAAAAIAAAVAVIIVGGVDVAWRCTRGSEGLYLPIPRRISAHIARAIIAFFFGLGGGALAAFAAAFTTRPQNTRQSYKLAIIATIVIVALWACLGAAMLARKNYKEARGGGGRPCVSAFIMDVTASSTSCVASSFMHRLSSHLRLSHGRQGRSTVSFLCVPGRSSSGP